MAGGKVQLINMEPEELVSMFDERLKVKLKELTLSIQPKDSKRLATRQQAADFFQVDISTIHNWCKSGKLNPLGKGNRVYFDWDELEKSLVPLNPKN